jgi:hypothetical protein
MLGAVSQYPPANILGHHVLATTEFSNCLFQGPKNQICPHKISCLADTIETVPVYSPAVGLLDPWTWTDAFSQHIGMNYQPTPQHLTISQKCTDLICFISLTCSPPGKIIPSGSTLPAFYGADTSTLV